MLLTSQYLIVENNDEQFVMAYPVAASQCQSNKTMVIGENMHRNTPRSFVADLKPYTVPLSASIRKTSLEVPFHCERTLIRYIADQTRQWSSE